MAKTATVNRRRRRRRNSPLAKTANPPRRRRRRKNYGAAAMINPPRRRRRRRSSRRRRNPASTYSSRGYYRRPNPSADMFRMEDLTQTLPAATAGIWASRWALKQAGPYEPAADGVLEPGIKHAIAIWIAAGLGGQLVGSIFGSDRAGDAAKIAALGFGGDLFLRARFLRDNEFVQEQLSMQGFYSESPIASGMGQTFTDGSGKTYHMTADGSYALAGQLVQGDDGQLYMLEGGASSGAELAGFQRTSALGAAPVQYNAGNSFGYHR